MDEIDVLLNRGVDKIYPTLEILEKILRSGKKLRLYQGFDPSGAHLHIGHAVGLRKLRQFQDLGHKVIFLIGDFTGMIGDPSGKKDSRKPLTREEVLQNAKDYKKQAMKILRFDGDNPVEIKFNSEWNSKLTFEDVIRLASHFTAQQMLERDMFQQRIKEGREINLVEFLYPIMVAYDAVAMDVDLELGGRDQTFNMLAGRKLHMQRLQKEKFVVTTPLLADSKGVKIGKSEGNAIGITDPPNDFYGKIMSLGDDAIIPCFQLLTDTPDEEILGMQGKMSNGTNPMNLKKKLAYELTKQFNDEKSAEQAQSDFETRFQKGQLDQVDLPTQSVVTFTSGATIVEALVNTGMASSNSEARRLVEQQGVKVNDKLVTSGKEVLNYKPGDVIKVGRKAVRIV